MWLRLHNVDGAPTDVLIEWLLQHPTPDADSHLEARRHFREIRAAVQAELQRRGAVHPIASEIEAVAVRDERTGAIDLWRMFLNPDLLDRVVGAMAAPFKQERITKVVGIESRGFPLATGVALRLQAGFVPVRKDGAFLSGPVLSCATSPDYQGTSTVMLLQKDALRRQDRVLVVDDWADTGSHLTAVVELVCRSGAKCVGAAVVVERLTAETKGALPPVHALVRYIAKSQ